MRSVCRAMRLLNSGGILLGSSARFVLAMAAMLSAPAWADLSSQSAVQDGITIQYKSETNGPVNSYDLGSISVSLKDFTTSDGVNSARMQASFNVNQTPGALPSDLFDHMTLHWYQSVVALPDGSVFNYKGHNVYPNKLPISDPPSGGWDYMYGNQRLRTNPLPIGAPFIDDEPFYYTFDTEDNFSTNGIPIVTYGVQYNMGDTPSDPNPDSGSDVFYDYLVARNNGDTFSHDPLALQEGQMLVLGGFQWHNASDDIGIDQTFAGAPAGTVASIDQALLNGGFPAWDPNTLLGWEAVENAAIVTAPDPVPEPATLALLAGTLGVAILRRRS